MTFWGIELLDQTYARLADIRSYLLMQTYAAVCGANVRWSPTGCPLTNSTPYSMNSTTNVRSKVSDIH